MPHASQREFADALRAPSLPAPASLTAPGAIAMRFDVHRNTFVVSLVDSLIAAFPATARFVGTAAFADAMRVRVRDDPPTGPVLTDYALSLPQALATTPLAGIPLAAALARTEAARIASYHAADETPIDRSAFEALISRPAELLVTRMRLHGVARWWRETHAVHALWEAHQHPDVEERVAALDVDVPQALLVHRPRLEVTTLALPDGGVELLDALELEQTLGVALEAALAAEGSPQLQHLLALLVDADLVVELLPPDPDTGA